jgi:SnoaL-like protein
MKRSREIEELGRDSIAAIERGDLGFIERTTSREQGGVAIGSDAGEYATGYEQIIRLLGESTPGEGPQIHVRLEEIRGYEQGDVGWADGTAAFERDGESVEVRFTMVAVREKDGWRIVQNHASIGVPNDRMFDPLFRRLPAATR